MRLISICIPMYNESDNINEFYRQINDTLKPLDHKYNFEFLFINDGSMDDSVDKVRELRKNDKRVKFVDLSRNYGKEIAMAAGFDYAQGDAVITMDADLQHPPKTILEMVKYWEEGYQDVYGKRRERKGESWFKKKCSELYYKILRKFSKVPVLSGVGDYRLLDKVCINGIRRMRETQRYTKGLYMWIGYRKKEVLFDAEERFSGETKWKFTDLVGLALDGITSNTTFPLKISTFVGVVVSLISFVYMIFVLISTLIFGNSVPGYPTLVILILFLGGFQLLSLGILGEYLGKIFMETKDRPLYFIQSYCDEEEDIDEKNS
ncbi:glycosyltransferase family 2 protein [Vagococcus vulneris]|uniref:Glycosyltransferase n=1 Tax=Vagococcus vulneris TaxID=1977869 RepID=A0A429ZWY6_9ENTE|nr:glycosyltransferase family 2 protein [Vagococcus vulneris]RST98320.1 glycosyltransferase [Vagococcus vulneris]